MWNPISKSNTPVPEASTFRDPDEWLVNTIGGTSTKSGQRINNSTALAVSTVYDCIRIISEDLGKLPLGILQEMPDGTKEKRKDNPLYKVLNWRPNPEMSAIDFRTALVAHAVGWGNAFAEKVRDRNGNIEQLWLLPPDRVTICRDNNDNLVYEVRDNQGGVTTVGADKIYHLSGYGYDGVQGYNPIQIARESIGLAKATEEFGSKFFGNGAKTSLALTFPNKLEEKSRDNLRRSVETMLTGENQHRILLVEEGGEIKTMSINQKDSQYLETKEFSITDICRWFRVQPHKVADLRRATFSNIEESNIDHVGDTLQPWFVRVEQSIHNQLLTDIEQATGYFAKHNANALLRGNTKDRFEAYASGINNGWLTRNEVREKEDLNPIDGLDDPLVPMNMMVVGEEPVETGTNDAFIEDVAGRIATAEERGLSARVDKAEEHRARFNAWAVDFYIKQSQYVAKCLTPISKSNVLVDKIKEEGIAGIINCGDPADHIKTWNRKQEIIDIINEALTCTTK